MSEPRTSPRIKERLKPTINPRKLDPRLARMTPLPTNCASASITFEKGGNHCSPRLQPKNSQSAAPPRSAKTSGAFSRVNRLRTRNLSTVGAALDLPAAFATAPRFTIHQLAWHGGCPKDIL